MRFIYGCLSVGLVSLMAQPVRLHADNENVDIGYAKESTPVTEHVTFGSSVYPQTRTVIDIPQDFGKVIAIFPDSAGGSVFWFEASDGKIRNVILRGAASPSLIVRKGIVE